MREHAERRFALSARDKDGNTERDLYEGLLKRTRRPEKIAEYEAKLRCPPLPKAMAYLFRAYMRIRRRKGGGFGLMPIEWPDIDAFVRNSQFRLAPWEVEVIEDLDDLFLCANDPNRQDNPSDD